MQEIFENFLKKVLTNFARLLYNFVARKINNKKNKLEVKMLPWIGGKFRQAEWIYEETIKNLVENNYVKTYVEPFGGAFWNYLKTDIYKHVNNVVYNDKNKFLVNLFYTVKNKNEELLKELENMKPANNIEFERCRDYIFKKVSGDDGDYYFELGDVKVAKSYVYTQLHIYNGNKLTPRMKMAKGADPKKLPGFINKLKNESSSIKNFMEKVNNITAINNKDYKKIIKEYDSEDTLFYLDPPYFSKEKFYGFNDFGKKEHKKLAEILKNIKGKFVLSYYWFDELEELFPLDEGYFYFGKQFTKTSSNNREKGCEILITNFYPQTKLEDYKETNILYCNKAETKKIIKKLAKTVNNKTYKNKTNEIITQKETVANINFDKKLNKLIKLLEKINNKLNKIEKEQKELKERLNKIENKINNIKTIKPVNNKNYKKDEVIKVKKVVNNVNFKNVDNVNTYINNVLNVKNIKTVNNINYTNTKVKYSKSLLQIINNINYINNVSIKKINNIINNVKELGPPFLINYIV